MKTTEKQLAEEVLVKEETQPTVKQIIEEEIHGEEDNE